MSFVNHCVPSSYWLRAKVAWKDLWESLLLWRVWVALGWQDILLRYRRSTLGPFWITISMAVMIYSMGGVYSVLFKVDMTRYFPHIATGVLIWTFFSSLLMEMIDSFIESGHIIRQLKMPYLVYVFRVLVRNYIIMLHNFIAIVPVVLFFNLPIKVDGLVLGMLLFGLCGLCFGVVLAMIGARYRDLKPIIQSFLQLLFYLTPIVWMDDMLPGHFKLLVKVNPINHLINVLRMPILGQMPDFFTYQYVFGMLGIGMLCMMVILIKGKHRIAYWI